jgi:hypothetical protein
LSKSDTLQGTVDKLRTVIARFPDGTVLGSDVRRSALAQLWEVATSAPDKLELEFRQLTLAELANAKRPALDVIDEGRLAIGKPTSWKDLAVVVGGLLGALDAALVESPSFVGPPAGETSYLMPEADLHLIPRVRAKRSPRPGPGAGFRRRATPHHRILPTHVGQHAIKPVWRLQLSAPSLRPADQRLFGAALLPDLSFEPPFPVEGEWLAVDAPWPNEVDHIEKQVDGAYSDSVFAAVWPELSMPPERLRLVSDALRRRSEQMQPGEGPAIVAAGSWHEDRDGQVQNVMRILDKSGIERLQFSKGSTYSVGGLKEGIMAHDVMPVLVNDDALVAFAICLDFCELETTFRYELDVDYVLVASLGNRTTMDGHQSNARRLSSRTGGRAFVVQQSDGGAPVGWVLPGADPHRPAVLEENRPWSVRSLPSGELNDGLENEAS